MPVLPKPTTCFQPTPCPLAEMDKLGFSNISGTGINKVMIVGEALGANERSEARAFVEYAEAGGLLEDCFRKGGYDRQQFSLNNIVRCQPPNNLLRGMWYEQQATEHCKVHFAESISRFSPNCLLTLGNTATENLTGLVGEKQGIGNVRGFVLHSSLHRTPVVASYHPSFINRGNKKFKGVLIRDIGLAIEVAQLSAAEVTAKRQEEIDLQRRYVLSPNVEDAWKWAQDAVNSGVPIDYDIETPWSENEDDESELDPNASGQFITQVQFGIGYSYLVMPWTDEFKPIATYILASSNDKWGWNNYLFDDPILRKAGMVINGEIHDLMLAWHFLQPDLPKGLQYATSFYSPWFGPWKHLSGADLPLYGAKDVDATYRCGVGVMRDLKQDKLYDSYYKYYVRLHPVLAEASARGIPIDSSQQTELKTELEVKMSAIDKQAAPLVDDCILSIHPKQGYKKIPKEIVTIDKAIKANDAIAYQSNTLVATARELGFASRLFQGDFRWVKLIPFNINSGDQLIRYIEFKGKTNKLYKVPISRKTGRKTVEELQLQRLYNKTEDRVLGLALERKKMQHFVSSFCSEAWSPGPDGKVHPTFKVGGTSNGQLSAEGPNSQQFPKHGDLARIARKFIVAPPGFKIVKLDYKSFHAQTGAAEAGDADYLRLAKLDIHSYVTAHFLKLPTVETWLAKTDPDLAELLGGVKKEHKHTRDAKVKHAILGINNGMGVNKLYDTYQEFFDNKKEAAAILLLLRKLFPRFFQWQDDVRKIAHRDGMLRSRYDCIRYFWEVYKWKDGKWYSGESSEEAIAYLLANHAHCHLKERVLEMHDLGLLRKYNLVNIIHDEIDYICPDELVDECITSTKTIMERPSEVMIYPICPNGLSIEVDVEVGQNWSAYYPELLEDGSINPKANPNGMRGR